jgi:hypothetical protein
MDYVKKHNENSRVYAGTKDADTILAILAKCKEVLGTLHYHEVKNRHDKTFRGLSKYFVRMSS